MNRRIVMNLREMIKSELSVIVQEMMINCYTYSSSLYGMYIIQLEDKKENAYLIKRLRENENFIKISLNGESEDTIKRNTKDTNEWNVIFIEVLHILIKDTK